MTWRLALLLDMLGCLIGGLPVVSVPAVWDVSGLPDGWRVNVGIALLLFSGILHSAWQMQIKPLVWAAVIGNIAWIIAGAYALTQTSSNVGMGIVLLVMFADGIMAALQSRPLLKGGHG